MISKKITDTSWMIKEEEKVGVLNKQPDQTFSLIFQGKRKLFSTPSELVTYLQFDPFKNSTKKESTREKVETFVRGFPINIEDPHEVDRAISEKHPTLPLFKKNAISKTPFVAGYFAVQFNNGWMKIFCPKLVTLEKYKYLGPFMTQQEVNTLLPKLKNEKISATEK